MVEDRPDRLLAWLTEYRAEGRGDGGRAIAFDAFASWWPTMAAIIAEWPVPVDGAVVCGCTADRLGYAFAGAYQAALRAMFPELSPTAQVSLCITEKGGAHPRVLETTLTPTEPREGESMYVLSGTKVWSTLSTSSDELIVAAVTGTDDRGRNRIRMVRIDSARPGVSVTAMPATPFAPEIEHGIVRLDDVRVDEGDLLDGDGYDNTIKPFRTIEDIHIGAASIGYLYGVAVEFQWPRAVLERLLGLVAGVRTLASTDPQSPATHIALSGFLAELARAVESVEPFWEQTDELTRERWRRDVALMGVAARARAARTESAWRRIEAGARS